MSPNERGEALFERARQALAVADANGAALMAALQQSVELASLSSPARSGDDPPDPDARARPEQPG